MNQQSIYKYILAFRYALLCQDEKILAPDSDCDDFPSSIF